MNTSQFMDKQIMDHLSNSQSNNDFIDLMNGEVHSGVGGGRGQKEEIVSSFDFQPIRAIGVSSKPSNVDSISVDGTRAWNSADSKTNAAGIRNYGSLDSIEPAKVILGNGRNVFDTALVSEIDRTMKKHADNLLHALESVSARLSQLESRTHHLENSVDDLKVSVGNNYGSTYGKMRQLENTVREVQTGVHVIKDKQEIVEAQLQLVKLQVSKGEQIQNTAHIDSVQPAAPAPQQSHQQFPPVALTQPPPTLPPPNIPPPEQQNLPPPGHLPNHFSQNQIPSVPQRESYFPQPGQTLEAPNQQYQVPPPQQLHPFPPAPPQQQYQPPLHYSQPPMPPQQHPSLSAVNSSSTQPLPLPPPPLVHHPEDTPYIPSQNYPPGIRQIPSHPHSGALPSQQFYGTPTHMYEPTSSRSSSGFSGASYVPSSGPGEPYPYGGSSSQYGGGPSMKPQLSSDMGQSGGSSYPQLPTARILPHALPTASEVGGGSGPAGTGNRVPIDDVVDKVTTMGFSRDQVRATVWKLTENGQSVDLNVVLDKLMNDGEGQSQRGWSGQ